MNLIEKAVAVEGVLHELDEEIKKFQSWSLLTCKVGCGKCCTKPHIEATPLEFLPLANYLTDSRKAEEWLEKMEHLSNEKICVIFNPSQSGVGLCSEYVHRGLICRLFGFSARTNKYGQKELDTCIIIKEEQRLNYLGAESKIKSGEPVPLITNFYMKLYSIDPTLANDFMPINLAIKKALELFLQFHNYKSLERQG